MLLKNRTALIAGAAHGLGRAIAYCYHKEGASLVLADLDLAGAEETLRQCESDGVAVRLDISAPVDCTQAVDSALKRFEHLDVLVNCAAICKVDPIDQVTPAAWDKVFAVNVRGAFFLMQAAARPMIEQKHGRIIQVSSPASKMGFPYFASYAASKAAVDSMVRSAALAWAASGITVNSLVPGRMTGGMIDELERDLQRVTGQSSEDMNAARTRALPMSRRVPPEEVAAAAVWLASDAAAYVTAERFNFTGGMELQ